MKVYHKKLIEDLDKYVVFVSCVTKRDGKPDEIIRKPYTRNPETAGVLPVSDAVDSVYVYDIMLQKPVVIEMNTVCSFNVHYVDDVETHLKHAKYFLDIYRNDMAKSKATSIPEEDIQRIYFTHGDNIYHLSRIFNFEIPAENIKYNNLSVHQMDLAQQIWMNVIRKYRDIQLVELDSVEQQIRESGDEEEIEDIEMIKQMFRDIPQEVDLTQYKTLKELIGYWPPLLLPLPEDL